MEKIRWGIVGPGYISERFAQGLETLDSVVIQAVASRSMERAQAFAGKYGAKKCYGSYADMLNDKEIDVVYIGTPHTCHIDDVIMFLNAGFNVLCEKPLGVNAWQVEKMIDAARKNNVFLMEGMWSRFFPPMQKALEWYKEGRIGKIKMLSANFGYDGSSNRDQWRFKSEHAGGAMLDVGIYSLAFAFLFLGTDPVEMMGVCNKQNNIDESDAFLLKYSQGELAVLTSAISIRLRQDALIEGEKGKIIIPHKFWCASRAELVLEGDDVFDYNGKKEVFEAPYAATGFQFEAQAVGGYVKAGLKESPVIPLDETLKIARAMDRLREIWGIRYPADRQ